MNQNSDTESLQIDFELRPNNYQPNIITESRQEFTEAEKRVVVLAINQLSTVARNWEPGKNVTLMIPYSELTSGHHTEISALANSLTSKKIIYQDTTNPKDHTFNYIVPFPQVQSTKIQGRRYLELLMLSVVVPSFIELGKRYTSYSVKLMLSLSSTYSQRMYEIIMMFYGRGQKEFTYEVSKLRTALNYPESHAYFDFKRRTLLTAQKELAEKIQLYFDFEPSIKQGKVVQELRFTVKSEIDLINEDVESDMSLARAMQPHEIAALARNLVYNYTFTKKQQSELLQDMNLMETFIRVHTEIHHGKRVVKNPTAYIAQALGFGKPQVPKDDKPKSRPKAAKSTGALPIGGVMADMLKKLKPQ